MKTWHDVLGTEKQQPYFQHILQQVAAARAQGKTIYPPHADVFNAFSFTPLENVKVAVSINKLSFFLGVAPPE